MNSSQMFSSTRTCEIVGITYRQLDYWARKGLFSPSLEATGSGSRRQYSYTDLVNLRVIKNMLDNGMNLKEISRATQYLATQGENLGNADLVMTSDSVFLHDAEHPEMLVDLVRTGQGVFTIVALSQASKHVTDEITSEDPAVDSLIVNIA